MRGRTSVCRLASATHAPRAPYRRSLLAHPVPPPSLTASPARAREHPARPTRARRAEEPATLIPQRWRWHAASRSAARASESAAQRARARPRVAASRAWEAASLRCNAQTQRDRAGRGGDVAARPRATRREGTVAARLSDAPRWPWPHPPPPLTSRVSLPVENPNHRKLQFSPVGGALTSETQRTAQQQQHNRTPSISHGASPPPAAPSGEPSTADRSAALSGGTSLSPAGIFCKVRAGKRGVWFQMTEHKRLLKDGPGGVQAPDCCPAVRCRVIYRGPGPRGSVGRGPVASHADPESTLCVVRSDGMTKHSANHSGVPSGLDHPLQSPTPEEWKHIPISDNSTTAGESATSPPTARCTRGTASRKPSGPGRSSFTGPGRSWLNGYCCWNNKSTAMEIKEGAYTSSQSRRLADPHRGPQSPGDTRDARGIGSDVM
ncbi:unnamed protein product [Gadus morhua 'NCC']